MDPEVDYRAQDNFPRMRGRFVRPKINQGDKMLAMNHCIVLSL